MKNSEKGRALFEPFDKTQDRLRELRRPRILLVGEGNPKDHDGRKWFWVLLPKQKDLVCRGETLQQ